MCTSSVQANAPAFNVLRLGDATQAAAIRNPDVLAVLEDNTYWNDLKKLNWLQEPLTQDSHDDLGQGLLQPVQLLEVPLLVLQEPLTQVIMAVQRGNATMADVC
eukprot:gene332-554_t